MDLVNTSIIIWKENELEISSVSKITSFDKTQVVLEIKGAEYIIKGSNLELVDILQDKGTLKIKGIISLIDAGYTKTKNKDKGFFKKILK